MKKRFRIWIDRYFYIIPFGVLAFILYKFHVPPWVIVLMIVYGIGTNLCSFIAGEIKGIRETSKSWKDMIDSIAEKRAIK